MSSAGADEQDPTSVQITLTPPTGIAITAAGGVDWDCNVIFESEVCSYRSTTPVVVGDVFPPTTHAFPPITVTAQITDNAPIEHLTTEASINSSDATAPTRTSNTVIVAAATDAASPTTTASMVVTTFSQASQTVTLFATVTSGSSTVNEGAVTFQVLDNGTPIGMAAAGSVSNGTASVSYPLPAGQAAGSYTIQAGYQDSTDFSASSDSAHTLTINPAATTTTASPVTVAFSNSAQNVTFSATVTSGAGTVNEGAVTFQVVAGSTLIGTATTGSVSNGTASVSYPLPAGQAAGSYTIRARYQDSTGNLATSSDATHTLTITAGPRPLTAPGPEAGPEPPHHTRCSFGSRSNASNDPGPC